MLIRLFAAVVYIAILVTYSVLRGKAFDFPSGGVEIAILVVSSLLLGLAVGRWWALAVPCAVEAIVLGVGLSVSDDPNRPDIILYLLVITLPFMLAGAAAGVGVAQGSKFFDHGP